MKTIEQILSGDVEMSPLQKILETDPPKEWRKSREILRETGLKEKFEYLPIERIDYLLRTIFNGHRLEVTNLGVFANSVQLSVRLHYCLPDSGEWTFQDGVGAEHSKKGIEVAVAIAESNAKKSAAKKIGKIFGRDLSRDFLDLPKKEETKTETFPTEKPEPKRSNPVKDRIAKQIERVKNPLALKKCGENIQVKYVAGDLNEDELQELTDILSKKVKS